VSQRASSPSKSGLANDVLSRGQDAVAQWAPTVGRVMLAFALAWFGYHELVVPQLWTGYVPGVGSSSAAAIVLVLIHGWVLLVLAVAIIAGIALRLASGIAAVLLLEIVMALAITGGLTDLTLRDVGVLGLAVCLSGSTRQRLVLTG
jgi:uncharacterized membrane protein YphA (DoxX/SURF4 family)